MRRQAVVSVQASPSRSRRHFHIVALGRSTTPPDGDLPGTAQPFRNGSTMLVITTSTRPSTVSRLVHAIRQPACSVANGRFDRCETRSPARLSSSVGRSRTGSPAHHEGSSSPLCLLEPTTCSTPVQHALLPISGRRPCETDGRARNWRAERFRVSALATRPGRSRFAACVRRFATRGCVRKGLSGWASGLAWPSVWPTVARVLADCLSAHRETSRPERSLVHHSRSRNART